MATLQPTARKLYPAIRRARWRGWLVVAALVCTVAIYSIELTHHHNTWASELACPVCHVMAHGSPNILKPTLNPVVSFVGWYRHVLPQAKFTGVRSTLNLRPQPRAPPVSAPSFV